ncbi:MAG: ATP-binding cassette domain-containing protein, partial [Bosea sp.]|nr:ATP-binding cassette domain-containing protein [Bosea sp. (in: a-proteobacteria)]
MMQIEARDIAVSLGGKPVLRGIDLSLRAGEMVGLIGPNGAGKTTLLRVLADLLPAEAGSVRYDGLTAKALGRQMLAQRIAFLAQGGTVHWQMRAGVAHRPGPRAQPQPQPRARVGDGRRQLGRLR